MKGNYINKEIFTPSFYHRDIAKCSLALLHDDINAYLTGKPKMDETMQQEFEKLMLTGVARLREHWLNQAEICFRQALAQNANHSAVWHFLGITLAKLSRVTDAIQALQQAVSFEPQRTVAWFDLAVAYRLHGSAQQAESAYSRALSLHTGKDQQPLLLQDLCFSTDIFDYRFKLVDYDYLASVRYGAGRPPHAGLMQLMRASHGTISTILESVSQIAPVMREIAVQGDYAHELPFWLNTWFPPLDGIALHAILKRFAPRRFLEIGSGISTKFARHAVKTHQLATRMISIDPHPRNEIDRLTDENIRAPLEQLNPAQFAQLEPNDILFLDSSHRAFQNSDVTAFFLDILPIVPTGVLIHVHDIYFPYDYPSGHVPRLWNEQYLLATALLFGSANFEILFPCWYVSQDPEWSQRIAQIMHGHVPNGLSLHGASFWMRKR